MPKRVILLLFLTAFCPGARAAALPPEKLLPKDTALVVTAPDFPAAWNLLTNTPYGRLWQDPGVKPFKDKFIEKFSSGVIKPLERNLSAHLADYGALAQGQATFAILPINQPDKPDDHFSKIFLLDTKDRAADLRANLAEIRQKWTAAGKPMKTQKIRDIDFTTLIIPADQLSMSKILSPAKDPGAPDDDSTAPNTNKVEITFGQSDSLLLVSDSTQAIEKVLARQAGGLLPALEEQPAFQSDFAARLRPAPLYAWLNIKDSIDTLTKASAGDNEDGAAALKPGSLLDAIGVTGLTTACFTWRSLPEGLAAQLFVGVPEAKRRGLLKIFVGETKGAHPPPFIPADASAFWRWRIEIPRSWTQLETMLNEVNPQLAGVIGFILQNAGKDKDEKYDLKAELLGNLGDDVIHYEKAPRGNTLADLNSAPSIYLIGSPNAEKLALALKTGLGFLGTTKDREFLGRQIYTLTMQMSQGAGPAHVFNFAGSGGYLALSSDGDMIEEYLRSNDNKAKALNDTPGLAEAAQRVGGMNTGLFGFDNASLDMRALIETLRQQPVTLQDILGAQHSLPGGIPAADQVGRLREWADFSLLPPFDAISQYFYFSVYAGGFSPDGFTWNYFAPTPPKLR